MLAFKFPLVAIFLKMICVVYCEIYPVTTCIKLLSDDPIFTDIPLDGVWNFMKAFKNLSLRLIDNVKFNAPVEYIEKPIDIIERGTRQELTRLYFYDLFKNHGINVSDKENAYQWCDHVVADALNGGNAKVDELFERVIESPFTDCIAFTTKLLKTRNVAETPELIFENMYFNWAQDYLMEELGFTTEDFDSIEEKFTRQKKMQKNVLAYTMEFFKYYQKVFDDLDESILLNFRTIRKYCEEEGYVTVMNNGLSY